jgi:hypothetical protein
MIKVGFICEGFTERKLLESANFKSYLQSINLEQVDEVINAEGSGNLLPHNIKAYTERLKNKGADIIIILTDLDDDICITKTKNRIKAAENEIIVIAVKKIEAWFLACSSTMQQLLKDDTFQFEFPENEAIPFETIRHLKLAKTGRGFNNGTGGKLNLLNNLLSFNLDIKEAAQHPNCPSAAYFVNKLRQIAAVNSQY